MCFSSPKIPEPKEPIDRDSVAAQAAGRRARQSRAGAFDESDTDVVGSLITSQRSAGVSTQLKSLMGA